MKFIATFSSSIHFNRSLFRTLAEIERACMPYNILRSIVCRLPNRTMVREKKKKNVEKEKNIFNILTKSKPKKYRRLHWPFICARLNLSIALFSVALGRTQSQIFQNDFPSGQSMFDQSYFENRLVDPKNVWKLRKARKNFSEMNSIPTSFFCTKTNMSWPWNRLHDHFPMTEIQSTTNKRDNSSYSLIRLFRNDANSPKITSFRIVRQKRKERNMWRTRTFNSANDTSFEFSCFIKIEVKRYYHRHKSQVASHVLPDVLSVCVRVAYNEVARALRSSERKWTEKEEENVERNGKKKK